MPKGAYIVSYWHFAVGSALLLTAVMWAANLAGMNIPWLLVFAPVLGLGIALALGILLVFWLSTDAGD